MIFLNGWKNMPIDIDQIIETALDKNEDYLKYLKSLEPYEVEVLLKKEKDGLHLWNLWEISTTRNDKGVWGNE